MMKPIEEWNTWSVGFVLSAALIILFAPLFFVGNGRLPIKMFVPLLCVIYIIGEYIYLKIGEPLCREDKKSFATFLLDNIFILIGSVICSVYIIIVIQFILNIQYNIKCIFNFVGGVIPFFSNVGYYLFNPLVFTILTWAFAIVWIKYVLFKKVFMRKRK